MKSLWFIALSLSLAWPELQAKTTLAAAHFTALEDCAGWDDNYTIAAIVKGRLMCFVVLSAGDDAGKEIPQHVTVGVNGEAHSMRQLKHSRKSGYQSHQRPSLGQTEFYQFQSDDQRYTVRIRARVVDTSCTINTESCCGDHYQGSAELISKEGRHTVKVKYYRGG